MQILAQTIQNNVKLWSVDFGREWDKLELDAKFAWVMFISQLIGLITLIELLVIKK